MSLVPLLGVRPAMAQALAVEITHGAQVSYQYTVEECLTRTVGIQAAAGPLSQFFVNVQDFNPCTGEEHPDARVGFATLDPSDFKISPDLRMAKLRVQVMACHDGGVFCIPVDIRLNWHATGPASTHTLPNSCMGEVTNTIRPARVTGSVKIEGVKSFSGPQAGDLFELVVDCPTP